MLTIDFSNPSQAAVTFLILLVYTVAVMIGGLNIDEKPSNLALLALVPIATLAVWLIVSVIQCVAYGL